MIEDKEVGELWLQSKNDEHRPYGIWGQEIVQSLIRKLVDERDNGWSEHWTGEEEDRLLEVLKSFGIPPEDWK